MPARLCYWGTYRDGTIKRCTLPAEPMKAYCKKHLLEKRRVKARRWAKHRRRTGKSRDDPDSQTPAHRQLALPLE